jgi:outer membrane protein TolC
MAGRAAVLLVALAAAALATPLYAQNAPISNRTLHPIGAMTNSIASNQSPPQTSATAATAASANLGSPGAIETIEQLPGLPLTGQITFRQFMDQVQSANLALAAERYNIPIARAQLTAASVYPDPTFQAGYGGDLSGNRQVTTYAGGLNQTVLLGGKIGAREDAASASLQANDAQVGEFLRALRGRAADSFIDGVIEVLKLHRQLKAVVRARQLVEMNNKRLQQGQVSEDEVIRARIGQFEAENDLFKAESALHQTLGGMAVFEGLSGSVGLVEPVGNLERPPRTFSLQELVDRAVSSRGDVVAADYVLENARANYRLAQADRIPNLTLSGNYQHFTRITNPIDPAPAWDGAAFSLSIPIPLSDLNTGALQTAYYQQRQAEAILQAAKLQAEADVRTAYEQYALSVNAVQHFAAELFLDADQAYQSRLFKMEKGSVSLVEVLDAHQALNQLYLDYYDALSRRAKALVALEQSAGIWDVDF